MYGGEATWAVNGSSWSFTESRKGLEMTLRKFVKQTTCDYDICGQDYQIHVYLLCQWNFAESLGISTPHLTGQEECVPGWGLDPAHVGASAGCSHPLLLTGRGLLSRRSAGTPLTPDRSPHCEEYVIWNSWSPVTLWGGRGSSWRVTVRPAWITARPLLSEPTIVCIRRRGPAAVLACAELINIHYSYCDRNSR